MLKFVVELFLWNMIIFDMVIRKNINTTLPEIIIILYKFPLIVISPVNILIELALKFTMILFNGLTTLKFVEFFIELKLITCPTVFHQTLLGNFVMEIH